jgi:hypothetical protein
MSTFDNGRPGRTESVDLDESRRRLRLAREQAAAEWSVEHFGRARQPRRWPATRQESRPVHVEGDDDRAGAALAVVAAVSPRR